MIAEKKPEVISENLNLDDARRDLLIKALNKCNNGKPYKQRRAAKLLGITERSIFRLIEEYDIISFKGRYYSLRELRKSN